MIPSAGSIEKLGGNGSVTVECSDVSIDGDAGQKEVHTSAMPLCTARTLFAVLMNELIAMVTVTLRRMNTQANSWR